MRRLSHGLWCFIRTYILRFLFHENGGRYKIFKLVFKIIAITLESPIFLQKLYRIVVKCNMPLS